MEFMECGYRIGAGEGIMRSDDGRKEVTDEFCLRLSHFLRRQWPSVLYVHWGMGKETMVNKVAEEIRAYNEFHN